MSVHIEQCEWFDAPPATTWSAVEDISSHPTWMRDAVEVRFLNDQREGVGTEFWCLTRIGPLRNTDVLKVTEWDPGRVMGIAHTGVVKGSGRFTLADEGTGTRFCWEEVLRFPWWMGAAVGERIAKPILHRVWRSNLRRLKLIVEERRAP
jgi:hypothetical protein